MSSVKTRRIKSRLKASALAALAIGPAVAVVDAGKVQAALDLEAPVVRSSGLELVVVEAEDCVYCDLFRKNVAPAYESSTRARSVPMRFADLTQVQREGVELDAPIDSVPTVLLVKNGHEAGRVAGYLGPENFFHFINYLISGAE